MKRRALAAILVATLAIPVQAKTRLGIDVLEASKFEALQGATVALITNQTGINAEGESTVDLLSEAPGVTLKCILTPEHGFRGDVGHGEQIADAVDPKTKLPVYSLYGKTSRPTDAMLQGVDTIVFDIQDIGTRFYTYISTMGQALEEAARRKIRFVVLDRPNPVRGDIVEGDILDPDIRRLTGYFSIPVRHGFTVGELADWYNQTAKIGADLTVIPMKGWKRSLWFEDTGLSFTPPSPNIRSVATAFLYTGIACFEATNVSVGRGTPTPFEFIGAPWINGKSFCAYMRSQNLPGVVFESVEFIPGADLYAGERCEGVRIRATSRNAASPLAVFVAAFLFLHQTYPKAFKPEWDELRVMTGSNLLKKAAETGGTAEALLAAYNEAARDFQDEYRSFFLYP